MELHNRAAAWFEEDVPDALHPALEVLRIYTGLPADQVIAHVKDVRDRAFQIYPYPCIGGFYFIEASIAKLPCYDEIIWRGREGQKLLDIGCCFGQAIRKLVIDGFPARNIYGCDSNSDFINLGYDLFLDRERLESTFIRANILGTGADLDILKGQLSIINAGLFFHLFKWDEQIIIAKRLIALFRPQGESLITGRQIASPSAARAGFKVDPIVGSCFVHTEETWMKLWKIIGDETGTTWDVSIKSEPALNLTKLAGDDAFFLVFIVRRS